MNFQKKVLQTIEKHNLINPGDRIVVGLSGGADSCALLHCLAGIYKDNEVCLIAAHLDHSIRGDEATRDLLFSKKFANECNVQFVSDKADVPAYAKANKISEEMAGRELRYAFFEKLCKTYNCNKIAVAHNKNDSVETILLNITRGAGSGGIEGIKPKNGKIIRPIIETSRFEIEEYAHNNSIDFVTDSTNLDDIYARNIIRNKIIPELVKINPGVVDNILRSAEIVGSENAFIDQYIDEQNLFSVKNNDIVIDRKVFANLHPAIKKRVILRGIKELCGSSHNVSSKQIEALCSNVKTGKTLLFGHKMCSLITNEHILLTQELPDDVSYSYEITVPGVLEIKEINAEYKFEYVTKYHHKENTVCLSADNMDGNLIIRSRRDGDSFVPYGMKGNKKIKSFFIDNKIPSHERCLYPLVICGNEICSVLPLRISDNYKVTKATKKLLMITKLPATYDEK